MASFQDLKQKYQGTTQAPNLLDTLGALLNAFNEGNQKMSSPGIMDMMTPDANAAEPRQPTAQKGQSQSSGAAPQAQAPGLPPLPSDPYSKSVEKALKEAGYQHTIDALNQGVPPEHIMQHRLKQVMGGMGNILQNFGEGFAMANGVTPISRLQKERALPPTTYEQQQLKAGGYSAQVTSLNSQLERLGQQEQTLIEQQKLFGQQRNIAQVGWGGLSGPQKGIQKQLEALRQAKNKVQDMLQEMQGTNPNYSNPGLKNSGRGSSSGSLPPRSSVPDGAKFWDTEKGDWVF